MKIGWICETEKTTTKTTNRSKQLSLETFRPEWDGVGGGGDGEVDAGSAQGLDYFSNVQLLKGWNRSKFGVMKKVCPDRVWEQ